MTEYDAQIDAEQDEAPARRGFDWSLNNWLAVALYSLLAGVVVNYTTGIYALGTIVTVVLFVLVEAIVFVGRRR